MSSRPPLRLLPGRRPFQPSLPRPRPRPRHQSSSSSSNPSPSTPSPPPKPTPRDRLARLLTRTSRYLPGSLRTHLARLRSAPLSHVGAFLLLHEITAVGPIVGLAWGFHAVDWVPGDGTWWGGGGGATEGKGEGGKEDKGLARWERYFRRKGWFGLDEVEEEGEQNGDRGEKSVMVSEKGYRIGMQIAAAYAITKMLLVPRVALSLWLTPSLARGFVRFRQAVWRKRT
ncbi:hypothetical protein F4810DRAFT_719382 [Camillea tinctor]|nr:hypothetical protein F4810DRAFT_719382 [Camillea tinctor]